MINLKLEILCSSSVIEEWPVLYEWECESDVDTDSEFMRINKSCADDYDFYRNKFPLDSFRILKTTINVTAFCQK